MVDLSVDLQTVSHFNVIEDIADALSIKLANDDKKFYRIMAAYYLGKMAASMRVNIETEIKGKDIPVNVFTISMAPSGYGKGVSTGYIEHELMDGFQKRFTEETFPLMAEKALWEMAHEYSALNQTDPEKEKEKLDESFRSQGELKFTFAKATPASIDQMRQKLLASKSAAINWQVDEIGDNLLGSLDVFPIFAELYDKGYLKDTMIKNTKENVRTKEIVGPTPANMLIFGAPSKVFDGSKVQQQFFAMLQSAYARRSLFAWGVNSKRQINEDSASRYDKLAATQVSKSLTHIRNLFTDLADPTLHGWTISLPRDVGIEWLTYETICLQKAGKMSMTQEIEKLEMEHRYWKTIKLAGAFAFVDMSQEITMDHLHMAIKLVEESGEAFTATLNREENHVILARFIAEQGVELTHHDLHAALPFYKATSGPARQELMNMAIAWGYKNHVVIRKSYDEQVELVSGEALKETDLSQMTVSYSTDLAYHYVSEPAPFDQLHKLTQYDGLHWTNHRFEGGHRSDDKAVPGFNMVVLDVDGGLTLDACHEIMQDHTFMTYTTKRHTDEVNRFRLILPINYNLKLDKEDYRKFMDNLAAWLPFETDESTFQRNKKWLSHSGSYHYNMGKPLLDCTPFIPRTSRNETYQAGMKELQSYDNLERWFAQRIATGNRNSQMIKFALVLVDSGFPHSEIERRVMEFNSKLSSPLSETEIRSTIMRTVAQKMVQKAA